MAETEVAEAKPPLVEIIAENPEIKETVDKIAEKGWENLKKATEELAPDKEKFGEQNLAKIKEIKKEMGRKWTPKHQEALDNWRKEQVIGWRKSIEDLQKYA